MKYFVFPTKQDNICDYNTQCFMYGGLMLGDIITNLFMNTTEEQGRSLKIYLFSKINDDKIYLYNFSLQDYSRMKEIKDTDFCYVHIITSTKNWVIWMVY